MDVEIRRALLDRGDDLRGGVGTRGDDVPDVAAVGGLEFGMELVHVVEVEDDRAAAGGVRRDVDVVGRARGRKSAVVEVQNGLRVAGQQSQIGRTRGAARATSLRREVRDVKRAGGGGGRGDSRIRQARNRAHTATTVPIAGVVAAPVASCRKPTATLLDAPAPADVVQHFVIVTSARRRERATANAGWSGWHPFHFLEAVPGAVTQARRTRLTGSESSEIQSSALLAAASQK